MPGTLNSLRSYPARIRLVIGRAVEVTQWGETDLRAKPMKGALRDVMEIAVDGDRVTYRAAYYVAKAETGPVIVLEVFIKKSNRGASTPTHVVERIARRLARTKEIEHG